MKWGSLTILGTDTLITFYCTVIWPKASENNLISVILSSVFTLDQGSKIAYKRACPWRIEKKSHVHVFTMLNGGTPDRNGLNTEFMTIHYTMTCIINAGYILFFPLFFAERLHTFNWMYFAMCSVWMYVYKLYIQITLRI